jgi:3-oxoacyl-[acyl-carrier protein] reductase
MRRSENKVVILSGGIDAICEATLRKFAAIGSTIIVYDTDETKCKTFSSNLKKEKIYIDTYKVDITNYQDIENTTFHIYQKHKHIDILINNPITRIAQQSGRTDDWQKTIDISLNGLLNCIKAISQFMIKGNWGRIINTTALLGLYGDINQANYISVKNGVLAISKIWTSELGKYGITVNTVAPGYIENEYISQSGLSIVQSIKDKIPVHKIGTPDDIANVYFFLASEHAGYISGSVINVDGGYAL